MDVVLCSLQKRVNSTRQPDLSLGTRVSCALKEPCTVLSPRLFFQNWATGTNVSKINYCYIEEFGRYYWIDNWTWDRAGWTASCRVDALASWKALISEDTEYVLRSSARSDGNIRDNAYPALGGDVASVIEGDSPWNTPATFDNGTYVVGVTNGDSGAIGTTSYYAMTGAQFARLKSYLMGDSQWYREPGQDSLTPNERFNLKTTFNPYQYIVSIQWFPFNAPTLGSSGALPYGWWELDGVSATRLDTDSVYSYTLTMALPKHPQSGSRGAYLNQSPYTRYTLYIQPWGAIDIPPSAVYNAASLTVEVRVDCVSGVGYLHIYTGDAEVSGATIAMVSAQVGVTIAVGQLTQSPVSAMVGSMNPGGPLLAATIAASISPTAGKLVAGGMFGAGQVAASTVAGTAKAVSAITGSGIIGNIADSLLPTLQGGGASGSASAFIIPPRLIARFIRIVPEDNNTMGRPLCQLVQLGSVAGFIQCGNADIQLPATADEIDAVNSFLEGGFFLE